MKINKKLLKQIISEEIEDMKQEAGQQDPVKLKAKTRTAGQTGQQVKDVTLQGRGTIDGVERGMLEQIYNFFNEIAATENIDLQKHRMVIQTALQKLEKLINQQGGDQNTQANTEGV